MARSVSLWIFILIALSVVAAAHYYVWTRLVSDLRLPPQVHRALTALLALLFALIPVALYSSRRLSGDALKLVVLPAFIWMGVLFLFVCTLLAVDVLRLAAFAVRRLAADETITDPGRRALLARLLAGFSVLLTGGAAWAALRSGLGRVAIREVEVRLARLPKQLHGTVLVQLSDIHVGPTIGFEFVREIVEQTNALRPDLIAITGDLVDGSVAELKRHVAPLANLKSKYGTYFVTGNHEYYSGADSWCLELSRIGVRVLRNERVSVGADDAQFDLAGVDDYHAHRFGSGHGANLPKALEGRDPERELVLLAHQPRAILEAERLGVGLQLSGHTHGGQIWPWNYLVRLQQPVVSGLAKIGNALIYVSNGTGYWGPPMRLAAPSEITRIVLLAGGTDRP